MLLGTPRVAAPGPLPSCQPTYGQRHSTALVSAAEGQEAVGPAVGNAPWASSQP